MCYLVTTTDGNCDIAALDAYPDKASAMSAAETATKNKTPGIQVWALMHNFELEVRVNVTDHFKANG